jgi:hypothetical protein
LLLTLFAFDAEWRIAHTPTYTTIEKDAARMAGHIRVLQERIVALEAKQPTAPAASAPASKP